MADGCTMAIAVRRMLKLRNAADVAAPYGRFAQVVDRLRQEGVTDIALDTRPIEAPAK